MRPIIMTGESVVGILNKSKFQTRRVVNPQPLVDTTGKGLIDTYWLGKPFNGLLLPKISDMPIHCPYGQIGDRLWVRETWQSGKPALPNGYGFVPAQKPKRGQKIIYRADVDDWIPSMTWRPPMFMPRWASRITLEIVDVRVERVQDISGEDAAAEGITLPRCGCEVCIHSSQMCPADQSAHILAYAEVWDEINAKRGFGWRSNPWVWVLSFRLITNPTY